ncbi:MAG: Calx-beta domain-containing protein, partial [Pseudomonadota bacterium]|nr:Calx-beta domain-containing protein [Pseudomonadota bacterium]
MNQAQQCEALFTSIDTLPQLTLSYEGNGQGQVNLAPTGTACGENRWCYAADTEVSLTPVAHEQSTFEGWQGHEDCQEGQITMETNKQCVARFNLKPLPPPTEPSEPETPPSEPETPPSEPETPPSEPETPPSAPEDYTLTLTRTGQGTVTSIPSGIECGSTCSHTYSADTAVTLTATAAEGFIFAGWQGDCVNGQVIMKAHQQCQAIFRPTYTLSVHTLGQGQVKSYPEGIDCNNACQAVYPQHTQVTLTPLAVAGSVFSGWQGDCAPSGQVNMERHQSCQAIFESLPTLQFTVKQLTVEESSAPVKITVSRSGQMTAAVSVDYYTADGSALADQDYRPVEGSLNWAAGDHSDRTITLELIADRATEADETVFLNLAAPSGSAVLGTPQQLELIISDTPWFSSVQLALPHYTVNEAAGHAVVLVSRAGSKQWPVAVDYATRAESAQADIDYTSVSGTLEWLDGDRSHLAIEIPILADGIEEANESFILTLTNPTHEAQLGPHAQAVVTIIDTPAAGSLEFAEAEYSVEEQSGALEINVKRIGGTTGAVSVEYTTVDGSAIAGEDYPFTQGSLHWAAGDNQPKSFTLPIIDDAQAEGQEHLTLRLAEPTGYANLGALAETQLSIADNDSGASGKLQWASSQYSVNEQHNQVTITVQRVEGHHGERILQYHTQDDSAVAGQDYTSAQGELHWPDGEAGERSFTISLIDDARVEATEAFSINLTAPDLNEKLHVAIEDNDSSQLQFTFGSYVVAENSPEAIVTVSRQGEGLNPVSVHYQTLANSAQAGTDYQAQEGTLSWFSGDNTPKTIAIPLIYDQAVEGNETLQVQLTEVNGPATLGTPASTTLIITEDDLSSCTPEPIIDCILMNHGHTLGEDYAIEITPRGAVIGGQLSGIINNAGEVRDVTLAWASTIQGGHVGGHIKGQAPVEELRALDAPTLAASTRSAVLRDVIIKPMTLLEYVTVGRGAELGHSITLGQGVRFEDNSTIPDQVDLTLSLGQFKSSILGQRAVRLNDDVLIQAPSILATINQLHELQAQHLTLRQDPLSGYLQVQVGPMRFKVLPLRVEHLLKQQTREYMPLGMTIMDTDQVVFVTH